MRLPFQTNEWFSTTIGPLIRTIDADFAPFAAAITNQAIADDDDVDVLLMPLQ